SDLTGLHVPPGTDPHGLELSIMDKLVRGSARNVGVSAELRQSHPFRCDQVALLFHLDHLQDNTKSATTGPESLGSRGALWRSDSWVVKRPTAIACSLLPTEKRNLRAEELIAV